MYEIMPDPSNIYQSPKCLHYNFSTVMNLTSSEFLFPTTPPECDSYNQEFENDIEIFNGWDFIFFTSTHWLIPYYAILFYICMLIYGPVFMESKKPLPVKKYIFIWNMFLSTFSFFGMIYTIPHLLFDDHGGVFTTGIYPSICNYGGYYGHGTTGFATMCFIYSKLFELIDTFFLIVRKNKVIFLHWYHHITVLLFCWHAYSSRIGTGIWFAGMNYTVHTIMYFYFALTQLGEKSKKFARKFSKLITALQILQMVVGMGVTAGSMMYIALGYVCYTSLSNSILGLLMYFSYLLLFVKLYQNNYRRAASKPHES